MNETMRHRLALTICNATPFDCCWRKSGENVEASKECATCQSIVSAVLKIMREPTDEMQDAEINECRGKHRIAACAYQQRADADAKFAHGERAPRRLAPREQRNTDTHQREEARHDQGAKPDPEWLAIEIRVQELEVTQVETEVINDHQRDRGAARDVDPRDSRIRWRVRRGRGSPGSAACSL